MSESRSIPVDVRRYLRKEACFGCAYCGDPILDYHHIVPWSERKHHEVEHMVAVCPTHHRMIGKMNRAKQYEVKRNPKNARVGKLRGLLVSNESQTKFILGTNTFVDTPIILSFFKLPIIEYRILDDQNLISVYLPNNYYWPELHIVSNDVVVNVNSAWDFEFRSNYLRLVRSDEDQFFEIDLREKCAQVAGHLVIGGVTFRFDAKSTNIGENSIRNCTIANCAGGISYGDDRLKLVVPNYAMLDPRGFFQQVEGRRA